MDLLLTSLSFALRTYAMQDLPHISQCLACKSCVVDAGTTR